MHLSFGFSGKICLWSTTSTISNFYKSSTLQLHNTFTMQRFRRTQHPSSSTQQQCTSQVGYNCGFCSTTFQKAWNLERHLQRTHGLAQPSLDVVHKLMLSERQGQLKPTKSISCRWSTALNTLSCTTRSRNTLYIGVT